MFTAVCLILCASFFILTAYMILCKPILRYIFGYIVKT